MNCKNQKKSVIAVMVRDTETPRTLFLERRTPVTVFLFIQNLRKWKKKTTAKNWHRNLMPLH